MKIQFDRPPSAADEAGGLRVAYGAPRRNVPAWRWYLIVFLLLSPFLYFGAKILWSYWLVTVPGAVVLDQATVRAASAGRVTRLAADGAEVKVGDVVASLDNPELIAGGGGATDAADQPSNLAVRAALLASRQQAQQIEAYRRDRYDNTRELARQGAATVADVDAAFAAMMQARRDVERARIDLASWESARDQTLRTEAAASRQQAAREKRLQDLTRTSPIAGRVQSLGIQAGDWVEPGVELLAVHGNGEAQIEAFLPPELAAYAEPGRAAKLLFPDGSVLAAKVLRVEQEARRLPGARQSPLETPVNQLVLRLQPTATLPPGFRVNRLPVEVQFIPRWRSDD